MLILNYLKYKYNLEPNQELFAYGVGNCDLIVFLSFKFCKCYHLGNVVSCFFNGFPSCVGLR